MLPTVANPLPDVVKLIATITAQKEEARLLQFLNGLDEQFNAQRSQMLLITPLLVAEMDCAALEQEEAQILLLGTFKSSNDVMAMYGKSSWKPVKPLICTAYGMKGDSGARCWTVVGYPQCHPKHTKQPQLNIPRAQPQTSNRNRWNCWI